jgi:hypothetical protein
MSARTKIRPYRIPRDPDAFRIFTCGDDGHPLGRVAEYELAAEVQRHPWQVGEMYLIEMSGNFTSYPAFCELYPL